MKQQIPHHERVDESFEALSIPVHRASTLVFQSTRDFLNRKSRLYDGYSYGLYGTPTTRELERRIAATEGGNRCLIVPSGLAAITLPVLALAQSGDELLVADCVYGPTREFCNTHASRFGINAKFLVADADELASLKGSKTRLVLLEAPGSYTMEIQDIEKICEEAHAVGALVLCDNTWGFGSTCLFDHGVDIVSTALSKYAAGHSDVCMGSITVRDEGLYRVLKDAITCMGIGVSADDAYLVSRGLESLNVRLDEHARRALDVSRWLRQQKGVQSVMHPADPDDDQYPRYRRYFRRGNGLVSFVPANQKIQDLEQALDSLKLFRLGASWGGTNSLVAINRLGSARSLSRRFADAYIVRLHMGLEDEAALRAELEVLIRQLNH